MPDNSSPLPAAPDAVALLEPAEVLAAATDPMRHRLLGMLADGTRLSVSELAARVQRPVDGISKHLAILKKARLVRASTPEGADRRSQHYEVPALFRTHDAAGKTLLDFGAVALRFE